MTLRIGEPEDALIEAGASREKAAAEATAAASRADKIDRLDGGLAELRTGVARLTTTVRVGGGMIGAGVLAILVKAHFG